MAVQQQYTSHPPPVSWRFSPLPTRIFGLLPDACSSESSDIELEHKQSLEERKLQQYRDFLEQQKQNFYQHYHSEQEDEAYYLAKGTEQVPLEQSQEQDAGRLFCIVGSTGSGGLATYATMSTLAGSSEGECFLLHNIPALCCNQGRIYAWAMCGSPGDVSEEPLT